MSWLTINGISVSGVASVGNSPNGTRRDVGAQSNAADGTLILTRQTRKRDLTLNFKPVTGADSQAWESFLTGEGHTFPFDASLYSSKGLGPTTSTLATLISAAPSPKFGAKSLNLGATTGVLSYQAAVNSFGGTADWTVMVWRFESAAWHHYVVRSDGSKWLDGVFNLGAVTTWLTVSAGLVTIANTSGAAVQYDDLVVFPFNVLTAWPTVFGVSTSAFSLLPYLTAAGDLVREAPTRRIVCRSVSEKVSVVNLSGRQLDARWLAFDLAAA